MNAHTLPADLPAFWRHLDRRMRRAQASAAVLIAATLLFLIFLEELWRHPYEGIWSAALMALTLHLLIAQWRLAGVHCPRCDASWTEGIWHLPNPFRQYHPRCSRCGFSRGDQV